MPTINSNHSNLLPRAFFATHAADLAPRLLNKRLVVRRKTEAGSVVVSGRIAEVEAYDQAEAASHTFRGPTPRCRVMFERAGHLYVYRSYGMHWCANVVCDDVGRGAAVLVRALIPIDGVELQRQRRAKARTDFDLCSGPGKLCQALGISDQDYGLDLTSRRSEVTVVCDGTEPPPSPSQGPRIGISKATGLPWRWWLPECRHVSLPRSG